MEYIAFVAPNFCCNEAMTDPKTVTHYLREAVVFNACDTFCNRYQILTEQYAKLHEQFIGESSLLQKIETYGYDIDKFWLLILFLADYTIGCFGRSWDISKDSFDETISKMCKLLEDPKSTITIRTDKEKPLSIDNYAIKVAIKESLSHFFEKNPLLKGAFYCTGNTEDNVPYHKWKFFIDMLDFFLKNFNTIYAERTRGKTDWNFVAQCLYVAGLTTEYKYLTGYSDWTDRIGKSHHDKNKYIGKVIKDSIKNCKDKSIRYKSFYFFHPEEVDL